MSDVYYGCRTYLTCHRLSTVAQLSDLARPSSSRAFFLRPRRSLAGSFQAESAVPKPYPSAMMRIFFAYGQPPPPLIRSWECGLDGVNGISRRGNAVQCGVVGPGKTLHTLAEFSWLTCPLPFATERCAPSTGIAASRGDPLPLWGSPEVRGYWQWQGRGGPCVMSRNGKEHTCSSE